MLFNHFKIAFRSLTKNKLYSFINIFGLALSLTSVLILLLYGYQELRYDSMHTKADKVALVYKERQTPDGIKPVYDTWIPMLEALQQEYAVIKGGTRHFWLDMWVSQKDRKFQEEISFVDPDFFKLFNIPVKNGDGEQLLKEKNKLLISQAFAQKYFGKENPIGAVLQLQAGSDLLTVTVAGVMEDIPRNSSLRPDALLSFENAMDLEGMQEAGWDDSFLETYILVDDKKSFSSLEQSFPKFVEKIYDKEMAARMQLKLLPFNELHNNFFKSDRKAYILFSISFIILLIACINYINLETVKSIGRTKEIGLRKVLGAVRHQINRQFLSETFLLTSVAFVLALLTINLALPTINQLLNVQLSINFFQEPWLLVAVVGILLFLSLVSGFFPAFWTARFQPVEALKGKFGDVQAANRLRRVLVVFQFSLAVILISGMGIATRQLAFMRQHSLGFDQENVLVVRTNVDDNENPAAARAKLSVLKTELLRNPDILAVASSSLVPSDAAGGSYTMVRPSGWEAEQPYRIRREIVDESYFDLYKVPLLEGREFTSDLSEDTTIQFYAIINQAALKAFGWNSIEGQQIKNNYKLIGLVADHHYENLAQPVEPLIFLYRPTGQQSSEFVSIRYKTGNLSGLLSNLQQRWQTLAPGKPFNSFFVDENFQQLYASELRDTQIITWFSLLAIVIACLGLLGLTSYAIATRIKEIGIRKVLGASVLSIVVLLSKDFLKLILVATLVAAPIAWWGMSRWLEDFAYRIEIQWWMFVIAGVAAVGVALLTISFQAVRAAVTNPVKSLKSE